MPDKPIPSRPIDAYKQIIDDLVEDTPSPAARWVVEERFFTKAKGEKHMNELVRSLTTAQRAVLAEMLTQERSAGIHDVLAALTWWVICQDLAFTYHGEPMPVDLSGMGLHGDYVGRLSDWAWPEDAEKA
jgi:hypothetical protein